MKKLLFALISYVALTIFLCLGPVTLKAQRVTRVKMLKDSVMRYGVDIEPYLKSVTGQKIVADFNYAPYINLFLKKHRYVKFPPYKITVGLDSTYARYNAHLFLNSGNRVYFPAGSALVCPTSMATNGNMIYLDTHTKDVFLYGLNLYGSKANKNYVTSQYGCGIALYAPTNVLIHKTTISKSTGDGLAVRTNWGKQSENIDITDLRISNASRAGMLVTGVINGAFKNIYIEETGEKVKAKSAPPQVGLSFEPNNCESKYVNCKFTNLNTRNNLGPVLGTANFGHLFIKNDCGKNKVDIVINGWTDVTDDPACYGATLDISTDNADAIADKYNTTLVTGRFVVNNASFTRNNKKADHYFFKGKDESINSPIKYEIKNLKLFSGGKALSAKNTSPQMKQMTESSKKLLIH